MRGEELRCYYCLKDEYSLPLHYIEDKIWWAEHIMKLEEEKE